MKRYNPGGIHIKIRGKPVEVKGSWAYSLGSDRAAPAPAEEPPPLLYQYWHSPPLYPAHRAARNSHRIGQLLPLGYMPVYPWVHLDIRGGLT